MVWEAANMTLVLETLQAVIHQSSKFIRQRAALNLPVSTSSFPFRPKQREAVELSLSNAPVVAIAGTPASGKTEIAIAALSIAIAHQRSTLVVAPFVSTLTNYRNSQNLPVPPLQIVNNQDYRENIKAWVSEQLRQPNLSFLPLHWLEDALFEELQTKRSRQFWLNLLHIEDPIELTEKLTQSIAEILPAIHPQRRELLVHRLKQSETLLQQRERLYQDYTNLSDHAIEQIVDASLPHIKTPILCPSDRLNLLGDRLFDLVIVEDSHNLSRQLLAAIALRANKIVLLGELQPVTRRQNLFNQIFQNLLSAYRLQLTENHRLHPDLALKIFPALYPSQPNPYTPPKQNYLPLAQGKHRFNWYDVKTIEQIPIKLTESLEDFLNQKNKKTCILIFSSNQWEQLQQENSKFSDSITHNINDLRGQEYDYLWLVLDKSHQSQPSLSELQIALTRAKDAITIIGDWDYYQEPFDFLVNDLHFIRDIDIQES